MKKLFKFLSPLLAFYGGASLWFYLAQKRLIFKTNPLPPDYELGTQPPHKERWFEVDNGVHLNALHLRVEDPKGVILYHHGNSGNLSEWKKVASLLLPYGYDILIYDYRGYGKSHGRIETEECLFQDGQRVYDEMKKEYGEERIVLYGRSLGSGIATRLASTNNPARLLLETPFYSMKDLVFQYYPWFPATLVLNFPFRNDLHLQNTRCPVHVFHGDQDKVVYYRSAEKLKRVLKESDRFHTIQGGDHSDLVEFPAFHEALKEALGRSKESVDQEGKVRTAS